MNTRQSFNVALLAVFLVAGGCGGGGGGGSDPDGTNPGGTNPGGSDPADITPEKFILKDIKDAEPGTFYTASMKVAGVNTSVKARVSKGGEFSLDGGKTWRTDVADVDIGDEIFVRRKASDDFEGAVEATLYVGGTSADFDAKGTVHDGFTVTTKADDVSPELNVDFPPPFSLTDVPLPVGGSATLRVRGTVADNIGVTSVSVDDVVADVDEEGNWFADYGVVNGDNIVEIVASDATGNESRHLLTIRHVTDRAGLEFGSGTAFGNPQSAYWDEGRQRLVLGDTNRVLAVDLATGDRSELSTPGFFPGGAGLDLDSVHDRFFIGGNGSGAAIREVDPDTGVFSDVSIKGDGNGPDTDFRMLMDLAVLPGSKRLFGSVVNDAFAIARLWSINIDPASAELGVRSQFSNENFSQAAHFSIDVARDRLLIGNCSFKSLPLSAPAGTHSTPLIAASTDFCIMDFAVSGDIAWGRSERNHDLILAIDLVDNSYEVVSDLDNPAQGPVVLTARESPSGLDAVRNIYYYFPEGAADAPDAVYAIDLVNGYRVIVSQTDR